MYIFVMCHNLNASGSSLCAGYVALLAFGARKGGAIWMDDLDPEIRKAMKHRQSISIVNHMKFTMILRKTAKNHEAESRRPQKMVVRTGLMASNELEAQSVSESHS